MLLITGAHKHQAAPSYCIAPPTPPPLPSSPRRYLVRNAGKAGKGKGKGKGKGGKKGKK